jgi:cytokinesis protein
MDSIFGRKKGKTRQPSLTGQELAQAVPYDKLAPSPRSPVQVAAARGGSFISAPITNPTLTTNGTELNKFAIQRTRADRERAYEQYNAERPASPSTTVSTADSSTLYSDSSAASKSHKPRSHKPVSSSSTSSAPRSPSVADFGQFPPTTPSSVYFSPATTTATASARPSSSVTTRSDSNRGSKYAPSLLSSDPPSSHPHLSQFYNPHRPHSHNDFDFPRPDTDEEIEALFENVWRTRDLPDVPNLSIEQKWHMVYNDWQIKCKEEKTIAEQTKRHTELGQPASIIKESPEWYIRKFLDRTITAKQAGSLLVSLRSKELSWYQQFLALHGTSVLAQTLLTISRKGSSRYVLKITTAHIFINQSSGETATLNSNMKSSSVSSRF